MKKTSFKPQKVYKSRREQQEYKLHLLFYQWCVYNKYDKYLYAIEHGEIRDIQTAAKLKRKGVKGGMADFLFMKPNSKYGCLWIEIKVGKNTQTYLQKEFQQICEECNQLYVMCHSFEELEANLIKYLKS